MRVRNKFLIVLFSVLLSHSVIAQTDNETSISYTTEDPTTNLPSTEQTTTPDPITDPITIPSCTGPDEFPLFSNGVCISRTAYTAIFLTSIILAGLSFLMLVGILILCCIRSSKSSDSDYDDEDISNSSGSVGKRSNVTQTAPPDNRGAQPTVILQNMTGTNPLEGKSPTRPNQPHPNNHYTISNEQVPSSASSAPYTAAKPIPKQTTAIQQKTGNQKPVESYEMTTPQANKSPTPALRIQPSSTPKTSPRQDGRNGKIRTNTVSPEEETQTSYF